jgi:Lrp/AsnC family transcriptional regulator of lysine biosynthesis
MDNINNTIIESLREDARTPFLQIAKSLNVSEGTIRKRVKDLVANEDIQKFTIETKKDSSSIVGVETETKTQTKNIVEKIRSLGIKTIYEVTGRFDIICNVPHLDGEQTNEILDRIRAIDGVLHTETFTVLKKN